MMRKRGYSKFYRWFFALLLLAFVLSGAMPARAKELITYPVIPYEGDIPTKHTLVKRVADSVRRKIEGAAHESRRVGETPASDGGGTVGDYDVPVETDVLAEEDVYYDGAYSDVAEEDSGADLIYLGAWTATAYCACEICCGAYSSGYTASGTWATEGRTIACNALPMGTQVLIDGNTYIVEDTGWSPYGDAWVDIFFASHDAALAYGMRTVDVYLIG